MWVEPNCFRWNRKLPNSANYEYSDFEVFGKVNSFGSQIDQEYCLEQPDSARTLWNPYKMTSQPIFAEQWCFHDFHKFSIGSYSLTKPKNVKIELSEESPCPCWRYSLMNWRSQNPEIMTNRCLKPPWNHIPGKCYVARMLYEREGVWENDGIRKHRVGHVVDFWDPPKTFIYTCKEMVSQNYSDPLLTWIDETLMKSRCHDNNKNRLHSHSSLNTTCSNVTLVEVSHRRFIFVLSIRSAMHWNEGSKSFMVNEHFVAPKCIPNVLNHRAYRAQRWFQVHHHLSQFQRNS